MTRSRSRDVARTLLLLLRDVVDVSMPMLAGLEAGRRIRAAYPTMTLVYVTVHEDGELADAAFALGASAFVRIVDFTKGSH